MEGLRLYKLQLSNFGKFHEKTIELKEGINLIYGDNEAGKSTIHSFIRGMLFGIEKLRGRASKDDMYQKYQPWDTPGVYSGSMDFDVAGKTYRVLRNFDKNAKNCSVLELETGRELSLQPEELRKLYGGLTEASYRNTISIEQLKARTDQELVEEIRNYITNLSLSKSNEVDVTKALSYLQDRRKEIEVQQISSKLAALEEEITLGLACETKTEGLTLQLKVVDETLRVIQKKKEMVGESLEELEGFDSKEAYHAYLDQFPAIQEKYRNYCERVNQNKMLMEKLSILQTQLHEQEESKNNISAKKDIDIQTQEKRNLAYCVIPAMIGVFGTLFFFGKSSVMVIICTSITLISGIAYLRLSHRTRIKQLELDHDLKKKQDQALRTEMSLEHMHKQKRDYQEQINLLEEKIAILQKEILNYRKQSLNIIVGEKIEVKLLNDSVMRDLEEHILLNKQRITRNKETTTREYESSRLQKEKLNWELNALEGNEETLLQNKELQKDLVQRRNESELELAAIKLAVETIHNLSVNIHDSFGRELNQLVSNIAGKVTDGKYLDIKIDEKINIKVGYKDNFVLLDKLSAGTIEQLYFALRIAVSNLVYGEGVMPILLDDCFSLYDDIRIKAALESLSKDSSGQILLFTCHRREKTMLDQMKVSYNYIDLSNNLMSSERK